MIGCTNYDSDNTAASFVVSNAAELSKLPTTKTPGVENLKNVKFAWHGSDAFVLGTGDVYMLDGDTDTWRKI